MALPSPRASLLLLLGLVISCGSGADAPPEGGASGAGGSPSQPASASERTALLARSRTSWLALKATNGAEYSYDRIKKVYPFGGTFKTTVEVRADQVVRRSFGSEGSAPTWTESGGTIGSNNDRQAAPALTIDELYQRCATEILSMNEAAFSLYLSLHPAGVIEICRAEPRGCQDDCGVGYEVSAYRFLD